jgi:DNA-binding CsgD family transcriptional regulator
LRVDQSTLHPAFLRPRHCAHTAAGLWYPHMGKGDRRHTEAPLIAALFSGVSETPLWSTFLNRLRDATGTDFAALVFHPPGRRLEEAMHLVSDANPPPDVEQFYQKHLFPKELLLQETMIEGRPHTLKELLRLRTEPHATHFRMFLDQLGISAILQMRVREPGGVDAWLTVGRHGEDFCRQGTALFAAIAPVLRGVLQLFVAMEQKRFAASLTAEAVRRLQFGWLTLDRTGRVLECDERGQLVLSESGVLSRRINGRLAARPARLEREIFQALKRVADDTKSRPRAITLSRDPWLDMLLVPARGKSATAKAHPAAIAYVHGDSWRSADRCEQLAELFDLSPREARLALALSRGMTLAEAAAEFRLTIETARTYSKDLYAKTGARGQSDLVRFVLRSVLAVAPEG